MSPINVYNHEGQGYFRVAKNAVFGTTAFLQGLEYQELQNVLNQKIRCLPGMLRWAATAPVYIRDLRLLSADAFRREFGQFMRLTDAGMSALQSALVEYYGPEMRECRPPTPPPARRPTRHCVPLPPRARVRAHS